MLSGGAEASILLWDLERAENTRKEVVHRPAGAIGKYGSQYISFFLPFATQAELKRIYVFQGHRLRISSA